MQLKSQVRLKFCLDTTETENLFEQAGGFHDAELSFVSSTDKSVMLLSVRLPRWAFLSDTDEVDHLTSVLFRFSNPIYSNQWGTDEEICRCMIYSFAATGNTFDLQTGDGGRSGSFNIVDSSVELITTREIVSLLGLT